MEVSGGFPGQLGVGKVTWGVVSVDNVATPGLGAIYDLSIISIKTIYKSYSCYKLTDFY